MNYTIKTLSWLSMALDRFPLFVHLTRGSKESRLRHVMIHDITWIGNFEMPTDQ